MVSHLKDTKKIQPHFLFYMKHNGKNKTRLVADGNLTKVPLSSVYSGVVSLRELRLIIFLAELNGLDYWVTYVINEYMEAETRENFCAMSGPGFGDLEGHVTLIQMRC